MIELVFATNNRHKLSEVQQMVGNKFKIVSLAEIGCLEDIPETGDTLTSNALQKARFVYNKYGCNVFADDTGLEVEALNGAPGVYSARYAGPERSALDNMDKLLKELAHKPTRNARFKTTIALILNNQEFVFDGVVNGVIAHKKSGNEGFGYDPLFIPEGFNTTFAEMSAAEKNKISHRGRATQKLVDFLVKS
jgi:XTP/dITP diphosphohydrolase